MERLHTLEELSDYYLNNNLDSCIFYAGLLKKEAIKTHNTGFEGAAYTSLGLCSYYRGKYFEAENYLLKAIRLQEEIKDSERLAHSYNVLSGIYGETGQYNKSTKILYKVIKFYESKDDRKGLLTAFNNLGYLYMKLEDYPKAMEYYLKAIDIIHKNHPDRNKGFLYSNLGICYKEFGQYDSAYFYYKKALEEYKSHKTLNAIPMLYQSIGNLYGFRLEQPDSAFYYFNRGISLAKQYDPNSLIELYYSLGLLKERQKKYRASIDAFDKSLVVAENTNDLTGQMQAHLELFRVNKSTNRLSEAINHFQKYDFLKDSINNNETRTTIARLEEKYKNEKNQVYIEKLKAQQKADKNLKAAMILAIIFLLAFLGIILYGIFQRKRRNKLEKELLRKEKEKVDEELRHQNRQLASQALMMMQKSRMLKSLYQSLKEAPTEAELLPKFLNSLKHQIQSNIRSEKDWKLFRLYFEQVNKTFFQKLKAINPELTQNDFRLAALIKLRLNIKEAATVLNLSPNSIKGARHRLRIKLGLKGEDDLAAFVEKIN
ncbi:MAG: tetratricopeptide repeat protein [Bacteroidales bacterium]|nr:tetratricopeptide repeat protein [Bacteroidales bacterium]